ncbi:MAG: serine hydrolase domain-containing protein [bacterium]
MQKFLTLLLCYILFQSCSIFEPEKETVDIDSEIRKEMTARKIPSVSACIIKDTQIVWQKSYGYADIENSISATKETNYTLMSVSKLVIVTAAMQLVEQGLLDLDADINSYLPFSVRNPHYPDKKITPLMLMEHTSGLAHPHTDAEVPGVYTFYPDDSVPPLRNWLKEYLVPGGSHYVPAVWKNTIPGQQELYSNIGTALLAYVVEVGSGEDYYKYCKDHIFDPLEMYNTSYNLSDLDLENVARPYVPNYQPISRYSHIHKPAGWLRSSVDEFFHFIIAYMYGGEYQGNRILQKSTVKKILKMRNPVSGICLIWNRYVGNWYGHSGGGVGASTHVEFQKDDRIGIIILSNKENKSVLPGGNIISLIRKKANKFRQK